MPRNDFWTNLSFLFVCLIYRFIQYKQVLIKVKENKPFNTMFVTLDDVRRLTVVDCFQRITKGFNKHVFFFYFTLILNGLQIIIKESIVLVIF